METSRIIHPIPPLFDENSEKLILGSFPSVKSREAILRSSAKSLLEAFAADF